MYFFLFKLNILNWISSSSLSVHWCSNNLLGHNGTISAYLEQISTNFDSNHIYYFDFFFEAQLRLLRRIYLYVYLSKQDES